MSVKISTKLKSGDNVMVISGKYKGKSGKIKKLLHDRNRCIVEGIAIVSKHKKATKSDEKSTIEKKEASIHLSNVSFYDKEIVKIGYRFSEGNKVRFNKKNNENIN